MSYVSGFSQFKFTLDLKTKTLYDKKIYVEIYNNKDFMPIKRDSFLILSGQHTLNGQVKQPSNRAAIVVNYKGKNIKTNFVLDSGKNIVSLDTPITTSRSLTLQSNARGYFIYNDLNTLFSEIAARYKKPTRDISGHLKIPTDLHEQIRRAQLERLEAYPNDFGSLLYLYTLSRIDAKPSSAKENLEVLAKFSEDVRNSSLGKELYAYETNLISNKTSASVGNEVHTFKVTDVNNKLFSNHSLKGQPYIIVFSATWCGPCQKQLPQLIKLYQTYKRRGLKVIYFNDDDNILRWKEHISRNKLTWINVSERLKPAVSKIPKSFGVYSIPTCLVVNKKGIITYNSDQSDPLLGHLESFIKNAVDD